MTNKPIHNDDNWGDDYEQEQADYKMELAAKIYKAMQALGMTQTQFAESMDKPISLISRWMSGTHNFTIETLVDIQRILGISLLDVDTRKSNAEVNVQTSFINLSILVVMYQALFEYIEFRSGQKLTDDEKALIRSRFYSKRMRKRQYFLQEGDVCRQIAFIVKGAARMFSVDEKGNEHIIRFGLENWWLGDQESYNLLRPSRYNIEILEEADLLVVSVPHACELRDQIRSFDLTIKTMDSQSAIATQKRIHASLCMTAEEKYDELTGTYPQFLQRFPQNMVASYLGLSPETLCRIRKNATLNKK